MLRWALLLLQASTLVGALGCERPALRRAGNASPRQVASSPVVDPTPIRPAAAGEPVPAELSPAAREAFDLLFAAQEFQHARIGAGGELSPGARAVRTLIREPQAPRAFRALFERGSTVGRLYALAAFWYLRPDAFADLVAMVQKRDGALVVATINGCIGGPETVAHILVSRFAGGGQLRPGTGVYALTCAFQRGQEFFIDFASGVIPIDIVGEPEPDELGHVPPNICAHPPPLPTYLKPRE